DDLDHDLIADLDDLLGDFDVTLGELGNVHQALDALFDTHKRTERNELGDLARNDLADLVSTGEVLPRIFLGRLERQRHALTLQIDFEHLDGDFVADLNNLVRVIDVLPRQLGNVNQTVNAAKIDE